jgi:hypothetical protein
LRPEAWPERFAALHWLLCDRVAESTREPLHLLQEWSGIVTAVLEQLGTEGEAVECLALMGISFNDEWRAQAIARMDRDPNVFDELCAAYPDWGDLVADLAEAGRQRPLRRS